VWRSFAWRCFRFRDPLTSRCRIQNARISEFNFVDEIALVLSSRHPNHAHGKAAFAASRKNVLRRSASCAMSVSLCFAHGGIGLRVRKICYQRYRKRSWSMDRKPLPCLVYPDSSRQSFREFESREYSDRTTPSRADPRQEERLQTRTMNIDHRCVRAERSRKRKGTVISAVHSFEIHVVELISTVWEPRFPYLAVESWSNDFAASLITRDHMTTRIALVIKQGRESRPSYEMFIASSFNSQAAQPASGSRYFSACFTLQQNVLRRGSIFILTLKCTKSASESFGRTCSY